MILEPQNILYLLLGINALSLLLFGLDKLLAKWGKRRIPEKTLLLASALLASPGALLGMVLFHHKVSKPTFRFGIPALVAAHLALGAWLAYG